MTTRFLLASLTTTTLSLAVLCPDAAQAGDLPSLNSVAAYFETISPKLKSYATRNSPEKLRDKVFIAQANGGAALEVPETTATAPQAKNTCLTKQYLTTGAILFEDSCSKQWAINSSGAATHKPVRRACLTKQVSADGIVMFRDTCTNEWAMNSSANPADPPR